MNFIRIPRDIIYDTDIDNKRVLIFSYLCCRRTFDNTVAFSINELCTWSQMKLNRQPGKLNEKYLFVLNDIGKKKYFLEQPCFEKILPNDTNTYYSMKLNTKKFDLSNTFAIIYFDELKKIINFKEELKDKEINTERITSAHLLLGLAYIRVNMNYKANKPRCCFRFYEKIAKDIDLSERYVSRIVEILDSLKIIAHQEVPRTRFKDKNGNWAFNTSPKVFANYILRDTNGEEVNEYNYRSEIQRQIEIIQKKEGNTN